MASTPCCVLWRVDGRVEYVIVDLADVDRWLIDGWQVERIEPAEPEVETRTTVVRDDEIRHDGWIEHVRPHRVEEHVARPRPVPPPTRREEIGGQMLHVVDRAAFEARLAGRRERRGTSSDGDSLPLGAAAVERVFGRPFDGIPSGRLIDSDC